MVLVEVKLKLGQAGFWLGEGIEPALNIGQLEEQMLPFVVLGTQ